MNCRLCIGLVCAMGLVVSLTAVHADDYVEDVYYWADNSRTDEAVVPTYNPRAKEIVFIEDTTVQQPADTVRLILTEAPL